MKHRGEIIERAVRNSGIPIKYIAKQLHKSRQYIYNIFHTSDVSIDIILQIGKIIHYDFSKDIKEIVGVYDTNISGTDSEILNDSSAVYNSVNYWKEKYLALLETHNNLLQQIIEKNLL